ncbi:hypothetical protein VTJ49DRAFT_2657 [Mycothermus thermophilus]|uniref:Uncharacterized protein n=1 Tax=Humicola insolens TaxID=85995 RepID=A0ABR3V9C3_HUMIN
MRPLLLLLFSPLTSIITICACRTTTTTTTTLTAIATVTSPSPCSPTSPPLPLGTAHVRNHCSFPLHLWSVANDMSGPFPLASRTGHYAERFRTDPVSHGISLKIARGGRGALDNGEAHTVFGYNLDGGFRGRRWWGGWSVWYDLSDVHGDLFRGKKVALESKDGRCERIVWADGVAPRGNLTTVCDAGRDLVLTLCA